MPSDSVSSSSTLQIFREASHLWGLLCPSVYLIDHFPPFWHVQGSTPTEVFEGGYRPLTHSSLGFPFHFSLFVASSLNLWGWWYVWSDCHLLRQSSRGYGWLLPPPLSSWRLRPYLVWQWSPTLTGLWWLSHQCTLWDLAVFCFNEWKAWSLTSFCLLAILDGAFPSTLAGVGIFTTPWFAGALSAAILAVLSPLFDSSKTCPVPVCIALSSTASRSGLTVGIFDGTEVCFDLLYFCLVCNGGMSSMNLMVSMGVSLVVPNLTHIASFCILSSFSRFVCAIVLRPSP